MAKEVFSQTPVSCYCMADILTNIIQTLKRTAIISSQPSLVATLTAIDKYGDNDFSKAYLLGHFFKSEIDTDKLLPADKNILISTIKQNNLDTYFYLKTKPKNHQLGFILYIFIIGGLAVIIAGTIQLINGNFWFGLGTKYIVPIVRECGYKIILGLIMFVGGLIKLRHETKRKLFFKSILHSTNNSN